MYIKDYEKDANNVFISEVSCPLFNAPNCSGKFQFK